MSWAGFAFWALFVAVGLLGIFAHIAALMIWRMQQRIAELERRVTSLEPTATLPGYLPITPDGWYYRGPRG